MASKVEEIDEIMKEMEAANIAGSLPTNSNEAEKNQEDVDAKSQGIQSQVGFLNNLTSRFQPRPKKPGEIYPSRPTEERYYDTSHRKLGTAIIFNQVTIKNETKRRGSDKDRADLKAVLESYCFEVIVYDDLTAYEIRSVLLDGW